MATKETPTVKAIKELADAIQALEKKIDQHFTVKETQKVVEKEAPQGVPPMPPVTGGDYFPPEWRLIIDEILSPAFPAKVNYRTDGRFELYIYVPRQYSNAKPQHWETIREDLRFKVLENALGETGVREYVQQILENLGPDIKTQIAIDKSKLTQL